MVSGLPGDASGHVARVVDTGLNCSTNIQPEEQAHNGAVKFMLQLLCVVKHVGRVALQAKMRFAS